MPPRISKSRSDTAARDVFRDMQNFSVVLGGPFYQLLRRARLSDDALQLLARRLIAIALLAWLPLLVLAMLEGHLRGNRVVVPFLADVETHIRFLVVVPLLLVAELMVHQRLLPIARTFLEEKLIPEAAMPRFDDAVLSASRLRNSPLAEALLLTLVYALSALKHPYTPPDADTWYVPSSDSGSKLSLAGMWYVYVSLPIFRFLLFRWYFRLFIWGRFLWQVSRIRLTLIPTHPDQAGGLGFLGNTVYAFIVLLVAHGALVAAHIAKRIFLLGGALPQFTDEILVIVVLALGVVLGPLLVFWPQLARVKRTGILEYGTFAERYVRDFDAKWLRGGARGNENPLGSSDIQSLADLANSYAVVRSMRPAPITRNAVLQLVAAVLLPIAPLLLTLMPLEALLQKVFGLLF